MTRRGVLLGAAAGLAGAGVAVSLGDMGRSSTYDAAIARQRAPLAAHAGLRDVIRFATLAASSHNSQPWRFRIAPAAVRIMPDFARRTPVVDPDDHHLYASLGCAAENLALASAAAGMPGELRFDPLDGSAVVFDFAAGAARRSELCDAIPARQSCRAAFDGRGVSATDLSGLAAAAAAPGVDVAFITERDRIDRVRDLVIAGNDAQMGDPAFMRELRAWMRFNPRAALARGDGLYSAASGNPVLPSWIGGAMFDLAFKPEPENERYARALASSSGVVVFSGARADPAHWVEVGRACQRFSLQATALGLKTAFINQPVEVAALRDELAELVGMRGRRPDIVMRYGYGPDLPRSPRRPVEAVIAG